MADSGPYADRDLGRIFVQEEEKNGESSKGKERKGKEMESIQQQARVVDVTDEKEIEDSPAMKSEDEYLPRQMREQNQQNRQDPEPQR